MELCGHCARGVLQSGAPLNGESGWWSKEHCGALNLFKSEDRQWPERPLSAVHFCQCLLLASHECY